MKNIIIFFSLLITSFNLLAQKDDQEIFWDQLMIIQN